MITVRGINHISIGLWPGDTIDDPNNLMIAYETMWEEGCRDVVLLKKELTTLFGEPWCEYTFAVTYDIEEDADGWLTTTATPDGSYDFHPSRKHHPKEHR